MDLFERLCAAGEPGYTRASRLDERRQRDISDEDDFGAQGVAPALEDSLAHDRHENDHVVGRRVGEVLNEVRMIGVNARSADSLAALSHGSDEFPRSSR